MKHYGCTFECGDERDDDFMRAYCKQIEGRAVVVLSEVFRSLVDMPSKRFWVSEERAAIVVSDMMRGATLERMRPQKREMFQEIHRRTVALLEEHTDMALSVAVAHVVRQPAPRFYLTPQSARIIFYRIKNKWYEKEMRKLRIPHSY